MQAGGIEGYPTRARDGGALRRAAPDATCRRSPYYEALALFKLAVILEGTYARNAPAGVPDGENMMAETRPAADARAAAFARGERR